jgi:hypothetical protein
LSSLESDPETAPEFVMLIAPSGRTVKTRMRIPAAEP